MNANMTEQSTQSTADNRKKVVKRHAKPVTIVRRLIQITCFIFLPSLFIEIFQSIHTIISKLVQGQGTWQGVMPSILLLVIVSLVTALAGRFFCGWMCAFGSMGDFFYQIPRQFMKIRKKELGQFDRLMKYVKYVLLAVIVILIWGLQMITVPSGINPWDLFGMLVTPGSWGQLPNMIGGFVPAAVLLAAIVIGSVAVERFFCRYFCPLGAYFALISRFRLLRIRKDRSKCGSCTLCTQKCAMGIDLKNMDLVKDGECINCMACTTNCPKSNAHLEMDGAAVNGIAAGAVGCSLILGSYYVGNFMAAQNGTTAYTTSVSQETAEASAPAGPYAQLSDGTYQGSGTGFSGTTKVSVTVENGNIKDITIDSYQDDNKYMNKAASTIIDEIMSAQSTNVDTVSGATYSSNGIIQAVESALSSVSTSSQTQDQETVQESAQESTQESTQESAASDATVSGGNSQSTGSIDLTNVADGTYQGSGTGYRGTTSVTVTVAGGKITDVTVDSYQDNQEFFERAKTTVIDEIIAAQDVNVDAVSGATYSSNSIMQAVADALNVSYTPSTEQNQGQDGQQFGGGRGFGGHHGYDSYDDDDDDDEEHDGFGHMDYEEDDD